VADKPNKADETEANEANKAEADEADGAIVTHADNKANFAKEANVINKTVAANKIAEFDINKANVIVEIVLADKAIAVDRAVAVNRANMANEADEASLAEDNESLANGGIAVVVKYLGKLLTLLPISLTKYSAIFAEVKGYFGISIKDNQLGGGALWSNSISVCECWEVDWSKSCSLRNRYLN
jgi:hypothetical protein